MKKDRLIGETFGDYYLYDFNYEKAKKYKYYYKCRCLNCGRETEVQTSMLINGKCAKCTCNKEYNKPKNVKQYKDDLTNKIFGNLKVNSFAYSKDSHSYWNCTCNICQKECIRSVTYLNTNKNPMCQECAIKSGNNDRKENIINDCGDYVIINKKIYIDKEDIDDILKYHRYISISSGNYAYFRYNGKDYFLHRYIMGLPIEYDDETQLIVDHINGNRLDNRKSNLRICKKEQNPINCKTYKNNTSGYKGITWLGRLNKWQVGICVNKKQIYLGVYSDLNEAIEVRKNAEKKYFGEFARNE